MKIKEISLDQIRRGSNWKLTCIEDELHLPVEEWSIESCELFKDEDSIVYSGIFVTEAGEVSALVLIKTVGSMDYGGDYCEFVGGRWRQVGLSPNPNAPSGREFFANPLDDDPSFYVGTICDGATIDVKKEHREGFKSWIWALPER
jgi:hypothetical protein